VRRFERQPDGTVEAGLDAEEAVLLQSLAGQVAELVAGAALQDHAGRAREPAGQPEDPAIARLLPDAYPNDAEASAEFRRFTAVGLVDQKVQNAETLIRSLMGAGVTGMVSLDEAESQAWLRSLTDIRLTIAARLGIDSEDDEAGRSVDPLMREIYDWLGFVQNSLIEALDVQANHG
jgi:Domain of unknown function (DUF2017)